MISALTILPAIPILKQEGRYRLELWINGRFVDTVHYTCKDSLGYKKTELKEKYGYRIETAVRWGLFLIVKSKM